MTLPGKSSLDAVLKNNLPAIGVDLGGTKLSVALVRDLKVIGTPRQVPTPSGAKKIVETIINLVNDFQKNQVVAGVGIATAGIVNTNTGEIVGSTGNIPGWAGTAIKTIIERSTLLPVHVDNDANAAAYAEYHASGLGKTACAITVTLGTGIGTGIIINGKLFYGMHWAAGEAGHMRISLNNERMCTCGLWDCWEAYGSGRGLIETARRLADKASPEQSELVTNKGNLSTQQIIESAKKGDILAQEAMRTWHEHICVGLVSLAHTLDPDCFFITGGLSSFVDYNYLRELFFDQTLQRAGKKIGIEPSVLGNEAGMIGAAHLVLDRMLVGA